VAAAVCNEVDDVDLAIAAGCAVKRVFACDENASAINAVASTALPDAEM
jgi:hypothetical protein